MPKPIQAPQPVQINIDALQIAAQDAVASAFRAMRLLVEAQQREIAALRAALQSVQKEK